MATIQFSKVQRTSNCQNQHHYYSTPKPVNGDILVYMQILHVNDIKTVEQTFNAKFYLNATWAQKWKPKINNANALHRHDGSLCSTMETNVNNVDNMDVDHYVPKPPPGYNFCIHDDGGNWPYDKNIYRPNLSFDNATTVIELKNQKLYTSAWRDYYNVHATGSLVSNSTQSHQQEQRSNDEHSGNDNDNNIDIEEYVVLEWKASGSGTFTYDINLENYPCDIQLLKIAIASLDRGISLHDDNQDNVQSKIRKDYVLDLGFQFLEIEEGEGEVSTSIDGHPTDEFGISSKRNAFQKKAMYDKWSRFKPVNPKKNVNGPRGINLKSKEETIQIHQRGGFPVLSYFIPVQRLRQAMKGKK